MKPYYIATPIYYPSADLHIGHTYCTVMADAMARYKRLRGYDVRFATGTDEHGQKIQQIAEKNGMTPQQYVDNIVLHIKKLWKTMEISYDIFVRTTDENHLARVQKMFMKMYEKGDIYKGEYEGMYCTPCESFWTEQQLVNGCCPDCGRPVEKAHEEAYFFKMSKYADRLLDNLRNDPEFLQPEARRNEMIAFIEQGLDDLCISRSSFDWGIPVPIDPSHVIYVWFDAVAYYITSLGYPDSQELYNKYWPIDVHLVGKEIVRFHSVIWPAMLMSLDLPLPKKVMGHGWLLIDGGKMSKSKGNVVDPNSLIERYGVDALKYYLLRESTFGQDVMFTNEKMLNRINSDLANDLGNLVSRSISMVEKYCDGRIPGASGSRNNEDIDNELRKTALSTLDKVDMHMDAFDFNLALKAIWEIIGSANKYIDTTAPWVLCRDPNEKVRLDAVLHNIMECIRITAILIYPFMHNTTEKIFVQIGLKDHEIKWEDAEVFDQLDGEKVEPAGPLFPRIDIMKELKDLKGE